MARRRKHDGGSLELLLDTICNTFGGIVFIAILVVILLQFSQPQSEQQPVERADPIVLEQRRNEMAVLKAKTIRAREAATSQRQTLEKFAPDAVREQLRDHRQLVGAADKLTDERDEFLSKNSRAAQEIESLTNEIQKTREQLQAARQQANDLESQIETKRTERTENSRLPVVRAPGLRRSIGLILRYGRMYVWHRYDQFGNRRGLNTDEFAIVEVRDDKVITRPIPTAGVVLDGSEASEQLIKKRLRPFEPSNIYITAVVRPDSFREFRYLRDILIELGFNYRLMPSQADSPVADRGGTADQVQ